MKVGDTVELPELKVEKKVKSLQVFHQPVQEACAGDRVGMCVTQLDTKLVERALVTSPKTVPQAVGIILPAHKVKMCLCVMQEASVGDRVGMCVTQFDTERAGHLFQDSVTGPRHHFACALGMCTRCVFAKWRARAIAWDMHYAAQYQASALLTSSQDMEIIDCVQGVCFFLSRSLLLL